MAPLAGVSHRGAGAGAARPQAGCGEPVDVGGRRVDRDAALIKAGVTGTTAGTIVTENADARIDGLRSSLSVLVLALIALFTACRIPTQRPSAGDDSVGIRDEVVSTGSHDGASD